MKLQGGARDGWTEVVLKYGHLLPRYPGVDDLRPAVVRPPPLLLQSDTLDERLWKMLAGYRAAVQRECSYTIAAVTPAMVAQYRTRHMKSVSDILIEAKIRPVAWCVFSIKFWNYSRIAKRYPRPAVNWIYSKKRLEERDDWYGSVMPEMYVGTYLHVTESHRQLIRAYNRMKRALLRAGREEGLTEKKVKDIVLDLLPPGKYKKFVKAAQAEIALQQESLNDALKRGDYIW